MVVDRFFLWVRDASLEQRVSVVAPMVRAFLQTEGEDDRETCVAALTVLAADPEIAVRRALADCLADSDDAPRHLLLDLLWDAPEVAAIVARRSEVLIEAELIEAAASGCAEVVYALASRRRVGPGLAAALAETVDRRGAVHLAADPAADLTVATQLRLVDRFGEFADLREAFATRPYVPVTVRHRILEKLAETMGNLVVLTRPGAEARGRALTRDAKDRATVALAAAAGDAELTVLVEHLRGSGQLTTRLMLRAACVGALRFVEEAIALLAGVPARRVAALVADGRVGAFRALYVRAGLPERAFAAFSAALDVHRDLVEESGGWDGRPGDRARFSRRLVERVLTRVEMPSARDGDDLLVLLRRFSADAAREQAKATAVERARPIVPALAAPIVVESASGDVVEVEIVDRAAEEETMPAIRLDPARDRFEADLVAFPLEDAIAEAATESVASARRAASPPVPPDREDLDQPVGLFSHLRLEDVPPEWLADDDTATEPPAAIPAAVAAAFLRGGMAA